MQMVNYTIHCTLRMITKVTIRARERNQKIGGKLGYLENRRMVRIKLSNVQKAKLILSFWETILEI